MCMYNDLMIIYKLRKTVYNSKYNEVLAAMSRDVLVEFVNNSTVTSTIQEKVVSTLNHKIMWYLYRFTFIPFGVFPVYCIGSLLPIFPVFHYDLSESVYTSEVHCLT